MYGYVYLCVYERKIVTCCKKFAWGSSFTSAVWWKKPSLCTVHVINVKWQKTVSVRCVLLSATFGLVLHFREAKLNTKSGSSDSLFNMELIHIHTAVWGCWDCILYIQTRVWHHPTCGFTSLFINISCLNIKREALHELKFRDGGIAAIHCWLI